MNKENEGAFAVISILFVTLMVSGLGLGLGLLAGRGIWDGNPKSTIQWHQGDIVDATSTPYIYPCEKYQSAGNIAEEYNNTENGTTTKGCIVFPPSMLKPL